MHPVDRIKIAFSTARPLRSFMMYVGLVYSFWLGGSQFPASTFEALPMLAICLAGFTINDIFDQETDRINHPTRALVQYPALSGTVTATYILLFISAMFLIIMQENAMFRSVWAIFFLLISNYNFFKKTFPIAKNFYIALAACAVLFLIDITNNGDRSSPVLYVPFALTVLARELACDIPDVQGDSRTIARILGPKRSFLLVTLLYAAALFVMIALSISPLHIRFAVLGICCLLGYILALKKFGMSERSLVAITGVLVASPAVLVVN